MSDTDRTDDALTRSEEELLVGTTWIAKERVRVVKRVISEEVQVTVTLRREEIFIEREPIDATSAGAPRDRPAGEDALLFTLHREEPVVEARVVPSERVRVVKYLTDEAQVLRDELRKERIDVEEVPADPA